MAGQDISRHRAPSGRAGAMVASITERVERARQLLAQDKRPGRAREQ